MIIEMQETVRIARNANETNGSHSQIKWGYEKDATKGITSYSGKILVNPYYRADF